MKDYYAILGVTKNASKEEIKKAYHRLAHRYHPDKKSGNEAKFKEVNEAYQTLSDDKKRSQYDQFGKNFESGGFQPGPGFDFSQGGFGFEDLGDIFEEAFGWASPQGFEDSRKGQNIEVNLEMELAEVLVKQNKKFTINKFIFCQRCQGEGAEPGTPKNECIVCRGTGRVQKIKRGFFGSYTQETLCPDCQGEGQRPDRPCNVCAGEGRIRGKEEINVSIPAGVDTNQILKVVGKGSAGKKGGIPGDLYIKIIIKKHPDFLRKGDDLLTEVLIPYSVAVLGGQITVKDIEGKKLMVDIKSGTVSEKVLRISGKGITHFSGFGRGNLFLKVIINVPKNLTREQRELLEEMKKKEL